MTKRVLSMLMALIMALSLCVPAFAADEPVSADEPAAEVEAPAAEAEETEAEAEPVEEAADAPEAAAVDEPEVASVDEPLLVALGVVSKGAHYDLKEAVEAAEKLLPGVQAGTLRSKSFDIAALAAATVTDYAKDPVENDLFKTATGDASKGEDFATVLATAEKYLTGIEGTEVDLDVTEKNVTEITDDLNAFLDGGDHELVDDIVTGTTTNMTIDGLKALLTGQAAASASTSGSSVSLSTISDTMKPVTGDADWTKTYQSGYLTKLQAAIDAVLALEKTGANKVKYADYKAAVLAALDALVLEADAAKPVDADATRLQAAIDKAQAVVDLGADAFVDKYVNINTYNDSNLTEQLRVAKTYQAKETSSVNKFSDAASFWKVNDVIEKIEGYLTEIPSTPTLKVEKVNGVPGESIDMTLSVKKYPIEQTDTVKTDGMQYYMAWEITQQDGDSSEWFNGAEEEGVEQLTHKTNSKLIDAESWFKEGSWEASDAGDRWELKGKIANVGSAPNDFKEGDVIVVHFWRYVEGSRNEWVELTDLKTTIEVKNADETVAAPVNEISAASYGGANGSVAELASSTIIDESADYDMSYTTETGKISVTLKTNNITTVKDHFDLQAVALQNGKAIAVVDNDGITSTTIDFEDIDEKLAVGDVTVILQYCDQGNGVNAGAWNAGVWKTVKTEKGEDCSFKITIDPMTEWSSTENVEEILDIAEALVESDYELNSDGEKYAHTIGEAFDLIEKDAALARGLLTATTPSTATNHNAIADEGGALAELLVVCGYLKVIPADLTEFNKLMDEIEELVKGLEEQDGTGTYTFDTLGKLNEVYEYYNAGGDGVIEDTDVKSVVAAAVKALQEALDGLVKIGEIDKSELEASIKAAEALNEEDYTAESWAALQTALDAAKDVLADEDATQAQLTNAADKLNKAVAALVKKDLTAEDLEEAIAAAEAAIADPSKYTDESVLAVQDAITAAKALGDDATAAEIQEAIDKLDAAVKGLVPAEAEEPEIPAAPKDGTGWVQAEDGTYYYYKNNAVVKGDWVKSKGLWYHMGADGTMDTGFIHIVDSWGDGWYYLEPSNDKGTQGRMRTGWQEVNDELTGQWGWFETRSNGHQGMCTYTTNQGDYKDYKPVK